MVLRQRASAVLADCRQIAPLAAAGPPRASSRSSGWGSWTRSRGCWFPHLPNHLLQTVDHVSFVSGLTSSHVDDILGRKLDLLLGVDEFDVLDGLESWPLIEEPYLIIAPPDVPIPTTAGDLTALSAKAAFVRYHPRRKIGVSIDRHLRRIGLDLPRTHEFDTPYGVAATVACGNAWAITTPLCIYEAGDLARRFRCLPLPGPVFKRRLSLISRVRELARVPREAADFAVQLLTSDLVPMVAAAAPWTMDSIVIGDKIRRTAA